MSGSKIVIQAKAPSGEYVDVAADSSGNIASGGGGGGGSVTISDGTNAATITDVSGKKSLDVNVTNIAISSTDDSIAIKSPTTGYSIEPTNAGSAPTAMEGLLEKLVLKALSRLTFGTGGELRVTTSALPAGTNNIGTVQANIGGFSATQSQQLVAQQNYQTSFRRNLVVS